MASWRSRALTMRDTLRSVRRSTAMPPPLLIDRNTGSPDLSLAMAAQRRSARAAVGISERGTTISTAASCEPLEVGKVTTTPRAPSAHPVALGVRHQHANALLAVILLHARDCRPSSHSSPKGTHELSSPHANSPPLRRRTIPLRAHAVLPFRERLKTSAI